MFLEMPSYCRNFRCISSRCTDNCCIGWEIDIDNETAEYYKTIGGDFGERLRSNITSGDTSSFILKDERCPFLNKNNLCDIIISLGENKLCQICSDHPRYFEWYADKKEGGIGLCCEEAARIIVTNKEKFSTCNIPCDDEGFDDYNNELYDMLCFARSEIIRTLEHEALPLRDRILTVSAYAEQVQFMADNYDFQKLPITEITENLKSPPDIKAFLNSFEHLEPIDTKWEKYLKNLMAQSESLTDNLSSVGDKYDCYLQNIAIYFIWRYFLKGVFDEEILSKVHLMAVSIAMIKLMYIADENSGTEKYSILAKNYSKEIEYSEENLEKIYDMAYDNSAFSIENILSIL